MMPPVDDEFVALTDAAGHAEAVEARARRHERLAAAADTASWLGTLRDLAERGARVSVTTRSGRVVTGWLVGLSTDRLVLALAGGDLLHLRVAAVRIVRPEPGPPAPVATGDRAAPAEVTLEDVLDAAAESGGPVVVHVRDTADPVRGTLVGLGEDIATLRLEGPGRQTLYLPLAAIDAVLVV
ncbi:MAG TPA: hypothetical protein VK906_17725 [Egicoccus sp.]|nr:hypothetical protein [Egicoccus sp.]HSK25029.1 hypothetical protein [Egicoccus sp.]